MLSHVWPQAHNDLRLSPSTLRKYACNFRTRTIPGDSTAFDLQDPKISGPNVNHKLTMTRGLVL